MKPDERLVTIRDNVNKIRQLLSELVLSPRLRAIQWSQITKQTPNIKIGYPGQHLASLITGMEGERTGARGNDLVDGSEVKSCSRIDQLDKCLSCGVAVARFEKRCSECGASEIKRNNDSKWLFGIRSQNDLDTLLHEVKRIVLVLGDYPNFEDNDFDTLRFQSFEIWPESPRHVRFAELMTNYYQKIYLAHKAKNPNKTPAPKNFWPYSYQFYLCNPILTLSCVVRGANSNPEITLEHYVEPDADRSTLPSVTMPLSNLSREELALLATKATDTELQTAADSALPKGFSELPVVTKVEVLGGVLRGVDEGLRVHLPLRDTDRISVSKIKYVRRTH